MKAQASDAGHEKGPRDGELVDRWRRGDHDAMVQLYDRHSQTVFGYLSKMVGRHDAEDILQETWMRFTSTVGAGKLRLEPQGVLGWLLTAAHNAALDFIRKKSRAPSAEQGGEPESKEPEASQKAISAENVRRIHSALETLPEDVRRATMLRHFDGMKLREVGHDLGVTTGRAAKLVEKGHALLRKRLS